MSSNSTPQFNVIKNASERLRAQTKQATKTRNHEGSCVACDKARHYSLRNATAGSTREARNAGMRYPSTAASATPAAVRANTIGSVGLT